jgi:hypothetical protein
MFAATSPTGTISIVGSLIDVLCFSIFLRSQLVHEETALPVTPASQLSTNASYEEEGKVLHSNMMCVSVSNTKASTTSGKYQLAQDDAFRDGDGRGVAKGIVSEAVLAIWDIRSSDGRKWE